MKRGIAGSMIFVMMDRHALLYQIHNDPKFNFVSDKDEIRPDMSGFSATQKQQGAVLTNIETLTNPTTSPITSNWEKVAPWYSDQCPPFNVVLTGINEMGRGGVMVIWGVEILNEGYGISIDDLVSEQQMTYVARSLTPWQPMKTDLEIAPSNGIRPLPQGP